MKMYSYILLLHATAVALVDYKKSFLVILSVNRSRVLCRQIHYDNTGGTMEKFDLHSDDKDPPNSFDNHKGNNRNLNNRDDDRIIFPDYEETLNRHSAYKPLDVKTCLLSCKFSSNSVYVCGTDGKTYNNMDHLLCAAKCGVDVRFRHFSSCYQSSGHSTLNQTNNSINACMSSCPTTSEYNPVCGTNNITYTNPGKLHCAQLCEVDIQIKYHFACPKRPTTTQHYSVSTGSPLPTVTNSDFRVCLNSCPTTSEYNPVCGSDGKTYSNIGKFECAKYCGNGVQLSYHFACPTTVTKMANHAGSTGIHLPNELTRWHNLL